MEDINFDLYWSQQLDAHLEDDYNFDLYWSQQLDAPFEDDYFEIDADYEFERLNDR